MAREEKLFWVVVSKRPCVDCLVREATQPPEGLPFSEWVRRGTPGNWGSLCGAGDQCVLVPSGYLESDDAQAEIDLKNDRYVEIVIGRDGWAAQRMSESTRILQGLLRNAGINGVNERELTQVLLNLGSVDEQIAEVWKRTRGTIGAAELRTMVDYLLAKARGAGVTEVVLQARVLGLARLVDQVEALFELLEGR